MENTKYKEIETIIKALDDELTPLFKEVKALKDMTEEIQKGEGKKPLAQLILRLTKTARRHIVEKKVMVEGREVKVGTNHQGLGVEQNYSSQLNPVVVEDTFSYDNEQQIRDILFDSEAVIDLTSIIKKQNQKRFLKAIKILGKYKIYKAFDEFQKDNLKNIHVDGVDGLTTINIKYNTYHVEFLIQTKSEDIEETKFSVDFEHNSNKPTIKPYLEEKNGVLKQISLKRLDENIQNIKNGVFISQNKEVIIKAIKGNRIIMKEALQDYQKEANELNEILNPILALEKL